MARKKYHADTARKWARCPHPWCTDCRTRRGHNRGNLRSRREIRSALLQERKLA